MKRLPTPNMDPDVVKRALLRIVLDLEKEKADIEVRSAGKNQPDEYLRAKRMEINEKIHLVSEMINNGPEGWEDLYKNLDPSLFVPEMGSHIDIQKENQVFTAVSNILKTKHGATKNTLSNIR